MKFALIAFGNEESYGLLFAGGELLRFDQEIRFFDAQREDVVGQVVDWAPDFIGFSPMTTFYPQALRVCLAIKARLPRAVSVFGGHHATSYPKIAQTPGIDVCVVGPARGAIERILGSQRGVLHSIPTTPGDLSPPARREYYRDIPRMATRYRKVMLSMMGCPWNCSYCSSASGHLKEIYGAPAHRRYFLSRRPIADIIAEAKEIIQYPTDEIEWVDDDVFAGKDVEAWIPEFADVWEKEIGLPMYISTTSRYALRVSDRVLRAMRRLANCVGVGVQAIRPESLRLFNRAWDSERQMKAAYDRLVSFGFAVNLQAILGLPVEDPVGDAIETVKGLQRIGPGSVCSCYPLMVYPGTAMERYCADRGIALNEDCSGDTNTGVPNISFPPVVVRRIRNLCKLATLFVKCGVEERWMRPLLDIEFDDETSRRLSMARYYECVTDRLKQRGKEIFDQILSGMNLRY